MLSVGTAERSGVSVSDKQFPAERQQEELLGKLINGAVTSHQGHMLFVVQMFFRSSETTEPSMRGWNPVLESVVSPEG